MRGLIRKAPSSLRTDAWTCFRCSNKSHIKHIMNTRSASADNICAVAIAHFSEHGYDASSLTDIAQRAGMRKASLYSHFASKDDLYLEAFSDAIDDEIAFMHACFDDESSSPALDTAGRLYCDRMENRYAQSGHLRFLLRTAYLPPNTLREAIVSRYTALLGELEQNYKVSLTRSAPWLTAQRIDLYGKAYLGIVDSLHVELIYAEGVALKVRQAALWQILSDSLVASTSQNIGGAAR
jgi:AcrR family transcriptional regulator